MILFVNSVAHFLVDALCVTLLFSAGTEGETLSIAVVVYNTLAFSTQCMTGLLIDRAKNEHYFDAGAMLLVILAFVLPLPFLLRVCIAGVGNSFFHTAAGAMTLKSGGGQARTLGIFVAPGAFGVTLGTCFPCFGRGLSAGLLLCAAAACYFWPRTPMTLEYREETDGPGNQLPLGPVLFLTAAVAVRAVGGSVVSFPWKTGAGAAFLMTAFVFAGKTLGGFCCDRVGAGKTALLSVLPAAVCIAFFPGNMPLSLAGQLLLNLTMPVTLWLLYRAMPREPGFAFGLAASALWPGTIAGMLFTLTGPMLWCCVISAFLFGLFAILYSAKKLHLLKVRE